MKNKKDELINLKNEYTNELATLDMLDVKLDALLNESSTCIMNITNSNDKITEISISSPIYKKSKEIMSLVKKIDIWREDISSLKTKIDNRRKSLTKLINDVDKKLDKLDLKGDLYE